MQMVFAGVLAALMAFAPGLTGVGDLAHRGPVKLRPGGTGRWQPAHRQMFAGGRAGYRRRVPVTEFGSCDLR
jgi:hypothetical protein